MNLILEHTNPSNVSQLIDIANVELGHSYLSNKGIKASIKNGLCFNACQYGEIVGFLVLDIESSEQIAKHLLYGKEKIKPLLNAERQIVMLKHIAVSSSFKRQGIGTKLIRFALEQPLLESKTIITIAWENNGKIALKNILESYEFQYRCSIDDYWKLDSLKKQYECPACGKPPCICKAHVFVK